MPQVIPYDFRDYYTLCRRLQEAWRESEQDTKLGDLVHKARLAIGNLVSSIRGAGELFNHTALDLRGKGEDKFWDSEPSPNEPVTPEEDAGEKLCPGRNPNCPSDWECVQDDEETETASEKPPSCCCEDPSGHVPEKTPDWPKHDPDAPYDWRRDAGRPGKASDGLPSLTAAWKEAYARAVQSVRDAINTNGYWGMAGKVTDADYGTGTHGRWRLFHVEAVRRDLQSDKTDTFYVATRPTPNEPVWYALMATTLGLLIDLCDYHDAHEPADIGLKTE